MNFKRWKLGLLIATFLSLFVAGAGLSAGGNWRVFVSVFCSALLTNWGSYLAKHPADTVSFDTSQTTKPETQNENSKSN